MIPLLSISSTYDFKKPLTCHSVMSEVLIGGCPVLRPPLIAKAKRQKSSAKQCAP